MTTPATPPLADPVHLAALEAGLRAAGAFRLAIPREALRGAAGTRSGALSGASLDFRDFREYAPGDDLRHIDWNAFARTERYTVKLYREEVAPHLDILLDVSRSMDLPGTAKGAGALRLAALLAGAAANAACSWRLWHAGADCRPAPGGGLQGESLHRPPRFEPAASPAPGLAAAAATLRRQGLRVLLSDLLWPADPLQVVQPLADRAASLHVLQVLADSEQSPDALGNLRIEDVETGRMRELFADPSALERYRAGLRAHQDAWQDACRRCGARLTCLSAEALQRGEALDVLQRDGLIE